MQHIADEDLARGGRGARDLGVTTEAKIGIALFEQFSIQRTMRVVADGAAFAQGLVFENHGPGLFAVTLRAAFIPPGHGQSALGFEDVFPVRIVAWHATHPSFEQRMMLRQMKLAFHVEVALKTRGRVPARIDNEFGAPACLDVLAAGAVTGFAARAAWHGIPPGISPRVGAGRKIRNDGRMANRARLVSNNMRVGNAEGDDDRAVRCAGTEQKDRSGGRSQAEREREPAQTVIG